MTSRSTPSGTAVLPPGDVDYSDAGLTYASVRQADPRLAARIHCALGPARTVLNVGAGTGNYEPVDRHVIALEPAAAMRAARSAALPPAINGSADAIPLDDCAVDAAMTVLSVHQWTSLREGLSEMRRVTRGPVVVVTFDPAALRGWWLNDYCPEVWDVEARRFPPLDSIADGLGGACRIEPVPVPADCTDGFAEAFFARPEAFLNPAVLRAQSAWGFVAPEVIARFQGELRASLASGDWDRAHGHWRQRPALDGAIRLVISPGA